MKIVFSIARLLPARNQSTNHGLVVGVPLRVVFALALLTLMLPLHLNAGDGYAIITTTAIRDSSARLPAYVEHLRARGFTVEVATEAEWGGGATGPARAAAIRSWLRERRSRLGWVLLIGNPDPKIGNVPMTSCLAGVDPIDGKESSIPTDLAYANLEGTWDLDGDGRLGEWEDDTKPGGASARSTVRVGRIPHYGAVALYPVFQGSGTNDLTVSGVASGPALRSVEVRVVAGGSCAVSKDGGKTWDAPQRIEVKKQISLVPGISAEFTTAAGHQEGDRWSIAIGEPLDAILDRLMAYENAPLDTIGWRFHALLPMSEATEANNMGHPLGEAIRDTVIRRDADWSCYRLYQETFELDPPPEATKVSFESVERIWRERTPGLVVWFSHGTWERARDLFHGRQAARLDGNRPVICFNTSCSTGQPEMPLNVGACLLRHAAVAVVCGTRVTNELNDRKNWKDSSGDTALALRFSAALVRGETVGESLANARAAVAPRRYLDWANAVANNLYGPPHLSIYSHRQGKGGAPSFLPGYPRLSRVDGNGGDLHFRADADGRAAYMVLPSSAPAPDAARIRSGGPDALAHGTAALSALSPARLHMSGLPSASQLTVYVAMGETVTSLPLRTAKAGVAFGTLTCRIEPPLAASDGVCWRIGDGPWLRSGETDELVPVSPSGSVISFRKMGAWSVPNSITCALSSGMITTIVATCWGDRFDGNEDAAHAARIEPNVLYTNLALLGDDWYRITLPADQRMMLMALTEEDRPGDTSGKDVTVWGPGQDPSKERPLINSVYTMTNRPAILPSTEAGEYLVLVENHYSRRKTHHYNLKVSIQPAVLGSLTIRFEPSAVRAAGAAWRLKGHKTWITNDECNAHIPIGEMMAAEFRSIPGWDKPATRWIELVPGESRVLVVNYLEPFQSPRPVTEETIPPTDWPMFRRDAGRGAASPSALPDPLALRWSRRLGAWNPAWKEDWKEFDPWIQPVVAGHLLFAASNRSDALIAMDTRDGSIRWRFFAEAPIRVAPVAVRGSVFVASDDGMVYCLDQTNGRERWRFQAALRDRRVLGNRRVIAHWPVRSGLLVADNALIFGAASLGSMGNTLCALDLASGHVIRQQDGNSGSFQGTTALAGGELLLPSGRSGFRRFEAADFRLPFTYHWGVKGDAIGHAVGNAHWALVAEDLIDVHDRPIRRGLTLGAQGEHIVLDGNRAFGTKARSANARNPSRNLPQGELLEYDLARADDLAISVGGKKLEDVLADDRKGVKEKDDPEEAMDALLPKWMRRHALPVRLGRVHCKAGPRLYATDGSSRQIIAIDVAATPTIAWTLPVSEPVVSLLAGDGCLFALGQEGGLYCFASGEKPSESPMLDHRRLPTVEPSWKQRADALLAVAGPVAGGGICMAAGVDDVSLLTALGMAGWQVEAVEPVAARATAMRLQLDDAGLNGSRVTVHTGDPLSWPMPAWIASLIIVGGDVPAKLDAAAISHLYELLHPWGGQLLLPASALKTARSAPLKNAMVTEADGWTVVRRGALPGAGTWSHLNADAARTGNSKDTLARYPLTPLWFDDSSIPKVWGRGAGQTKPLLAGGRMMVHGAKMLNMLDAYTGRLLWQRPLVASGDKGGSMVLLEDAFYVHEGNAVRHLNPATGAEVFSVTMGNDQPGYIAVVGDVLIVGQRTKAAGLDLSLPPKGPAKPASFRGLLALDRLTGARRWAMDAPGALSTDSIAVGTDRIFCLTAGGTNAPARLRAYALADGRELWAQDPKVQTGRLIYDSVSDTLVQWKMEFSNSTAGKEADVATVLVRSGADGVERWRDERKDRWYAPVLPPGGRMLANQLTTPFSGGRVNTAGFQASATCDPITGTWTPAAYNADRGGCGKSVSSLAIQSWGKIFAYSLPPDGDWAGHVFISEINIACAENMLPAGGLLVCESQYANKCKCNSYSIQCSIGLVHDPEQEAWVYIDRPTEPRLDIAAGPIRRLGINLGAPGHRRADDGTIWHAYGTFYDTIPPDVWRDRNFQAVAWSEPPLSTMSGVGRLEVEKIFRHSARMRGEGPSFVTGSCIVGMRSLALDLRNKGRYTVRLFFAEPDPIATGARVQDIALQGRTVLENFDIIATAGGPATGVVRTFTGVAVDGQLRIDLTARAGKTLLSGIEVIAEP